MMLLRLLFVCWACLIGVAPHAVAAERASLPAVVVWDFENQTVPQLTSLGQLDYLARVFSEAVLWALLETPGIRVVERHQLKAVLTEQKIASSALVDADSRMKLGKLIGAQRMVFGSYMAVGDQIQVNMRTVDTETSQVLFADEITADSVQVFADVPKMAARLSSHFSGISGIAKSKSKDLWVDYEHALALSDAGQYNEAIEVLKNLLSKDASFTPAERLMSVVLEKLARQ